MAAALLERPALPSLELTGVAEHALERLTREVDAQVEVLKAGASDSL